MAVMKCSGSSTAAIDGWRWGSMKPGRRTCRSKVRSTTCGCASSQGWRVSRVPVSTILPSRTATASARGIDGFMVWIRRAVWTVIVDMSTSFERSRTIVPDASRHCPAASMTLRPPWGLGPDV